MARPTPACLAEPLTAFMSNHPAVRFVRLLWIDLTGTTRARVLTAVRFGQGLRGKWLLRIGGNFLALADNEAPLNVCNPAWSVGQCCLVADPTSIRLWPSDKTHAVVFCYFAKPTENPASDIQYHELCPRHNLHRSLQSARDIGLELLVGTEIEFVCTKSPRADSSIEVQQVSGLRCLESFMLPILCEVSEHLGQGNILVQQFYAEGGEGQYEIALEPCPPTEALDALVLTREIIWNVCHRHGVQVSFHPRVGTPGRWAYNGVHLNISLHGEVLAKGKVDGQFIAGAFDHIDSLFAFGLPHPECYHRTQPNQQAIGRFKSWGTENRTVPVRRKGDHLWEFRFLDATANLYLFLAALTAVGADGMEKEAQLTLSDCSGKPLSRLKRLSAIIPILLLAMPLSYFASSFHLH
ncbi:glutamine synthetase [Apiospora marii]|uniref:Glutamine synthetase n=1 Tax=Apiospora marii TaxID=335849 RepID=A0ABR1RC48_9PEZI